MLFDTGPDEALFERNGVVNVLKDAPNRHPDTPIHNVSEPIVNRMFDCGMTP
jgi:hypothetical protein